MSLLRASIATFITTGCAILFIVSPAAALLPNVLALKLRGGSESKLEAEAPWRLANAQGSAHHTAGEWSDAVAAYSIALASDSTPPNAAAILHCNRASALLKQGYFVKAGEDALSGIELLSGRESLDLTPEIVRFLQQKLLIMVRQASLGPDLGVAVERAAADTREVCMAAQTSIERGPLREALGDLGATLYFYEAGFQGLSTHSQHRFLATIWVSSCITVFASGPHCRAFGAHVNGAQLLGSIMDERKPLLQFRKVLEDVSTSMQDVFRDVESSQVTISLVGGYTKQDYSGMERLKLFFPEEEALWCFSGVMRRWAAEALPGALIDVSLLNRFDGADWSESVQNKAGHWEAPDRDQLMRQGQLFQVVALDSYTGNIVTQTKDEELPVPQSVLDDACKRSQELRDGHHPQRSA